MVTLKTKSAGNGYPKKAIEKTVLRFLGSRTFLHGLGSTAVVPQLPRAPVNDQSVTVILSYNSPPTGCAPAMVTGWVPSGPEPSAEAPMGPDGMPPVGAGEGGPVGFNSLLVDG